MISTKSSKVVLITIGNGINVLINFLTLPYLVRSLSFNDYGSYGQILMIITILQGFFTFNLNQTSNVYFANDHRDKKVVFSTLIRSAVGMSLIGVLVMYLTSSYISNIFDNAQIKHLLILSLINMFSQVITPILISILLFFERVQYTVIVLVTTNIFKILMMLMSINYFKSLNILMLSLSLVSLVQMLAFFIVVPSNLISFKYFDKSLAKNMFSVASPLAFSSIVEKSLVYLDGFMISALITTSAYAFYRAGAVEVPFIATLYGSVTSIVLPEIAKMFSDGRLNDIVKMKRTAISSTVIFVYPVLVYFLFFATPLVSFYLSKNYTSSIAVFSIFNLSLLVRVNDYQDVIIISRNGKFIFKTVCFVSIMNLILTFSLIKLIGINGGALSFVFSLVIFASILLYKSTRILKCKVSDLFDFPLILKVLSISILLCLVISALYNFVFPNVWLIIFSAPIYFILLFAFGIRLRLIPISLFVYISSKIKILKKINYETRIAG